MYPITCIPDSSVAHSTVIYPLFPRTLEQYIGMSTHSPTVLQKAQNVQHILQGPKETAVYMTGDIPVEHSYFLKKQMRKCLSHDNNSGVLQ